MSNPIQAIRQVYDVVKSSRDNDKPLSDEVIQELLDNSVKDKELIKKYKRFEAGYAAEDLFMYIYSLLPWVKVITPLGQEQYPSESKEELQTPDYEVMYTVGDDEHTSSLLIEAKLVDGDKQTHEVKKFQLEVLQKYAKEKGMPLLFALFWRKYLTWTVVPIEAYEEKSSSYKISIGKALANDVSAIFGDYTYLFDKEFYRKSTFSSKSDVESEYVHSHEIYGRTTYEGISKDGAKFDKLDIFEPPLLDCAFDFRVEKVNKNGTETETGTELIEKIDKLPYTYRLSRLMLAYLLKVYCYDKSDMYLRQNALVENAFHIVDTVRQKCLGKKYYVVPEKNDTTSKLFHLQFGKSSWIIDAYEETVERKDGKLLIVSHEVSTNSHMKPNDKSPLVSVIIPTYERVQSLKRAIDSVLNQTYDNIELIVVDDNGNNTQERKLTEDLMSQYKHCPNVFYICYDNHMNASFARNIGIKNSRGHYITFLDNDDEMLPLKIEKQVNKMENIDTSYGACYTGHIVKKNSNLIYSLEKREGQPYFDALARNYFICGGSNLFLRREVIDKVGYFDVSFMRNQDIEYLVRIIEQYKIAYVEGYHLIIHIENIEKRKQKSTLQHCMEIDQFYINKFEKRINSLNQEDKKKFYQILALNRFKIWLDRGSILCALLDVIKNKVGIVLLFKYIKYLLNRKKNHTTYGFNF